MKTLCPLVRTSELAEPDPRNGTGVRIDGPLPCEDGPAGLNTLAESMISGRTPFLKGVENDGRLV